MVEFSEKSTNFLYHNQIIHEKKNELIRVKIVNFSEKNILFANTQNYYYY